MKPAPFDYICVEHPDEVVSVLGEYGDDARILAGGQSLIPMLSLRLSHARALVDITRLGQLGGWRREDGHIYVGAGVRQQALQELESHKSDTSLLQSVSPWLGHYQTRARGTVVGSIAHADPSAELPLCLIALEGEVMVRSTRGARRISAQEFFKGTMLTDVAADEFIEAVRFPLERTQTRTAFAEFGRRHGDFAIVAAAAVRDDRGVHLSIGGVNDVPVRTSWDLLALNDIDDAVNELAWRLDCRADLHATEHLRRNLIRSLGARTLREVLT